jgi:hypothetical protein
VQKEKAIIIAIRIKLIKSYLKGILFFNALLLRNNTSTPRDIKIKGQKSNILFSKGILKTVNKK